MAEDKTSDYRYRGVITTKKVGPVYNAQRRADIVARGNSLDYWRQAFADDDATIGQSGTVIVGHYDDVKSVKGNITRAKRRIYSHEVITDITIQQARLVWEDMQ